MSSQETSPTSPTQSDKSPQNTIRVIKTNEKEQTVVEVKVAGEDGAKVTVFGGEGPTVNGITNKSDDKQQDDNKISDTKDENRKGDKTQETDADDNDDDDDIQPLTKKEIDEIVAKFEKKFEKKELDRFLEFFWSVDKYGFGFFTFPQFVYRMRMMRSFKSQRELASLFADLDHDMDQVVSLEEFLDEMSRPKPKPRTEEYYKDMFAQCDKNNDGYICYEDIATCLQEKNVPYLEVEIIYFLEKNKAGLDEKLDYSEFKRALKRN